MSFVLERYLKDFGAPQPAQSAFNDFSAGIFENDSLSAFEESDAARPVDPEALRSEAYAEGFEAASAELTARHEEAIAALREQHAREIERIEQKYRGKIAIALAMGLKQIAAQLAVGIGDQVAECLAPVLQQQVAEKAVADMAMLVQEAILEGQAGSIMVKGSLPLFNVLATEMGEDAALLRHVEAEDLDLSVEMSGSVLVTRLSAFAASLKKVLE